MNALKPLGPPILANLEIIWDILAPVGGLIGPRNPKPIIPLRNTAVPDIMEIGVKVI
jgi:hypothetical protein